MYYYYPKYQIITSHDASKPGVSDRILHAFCECFKVVSKSYIWKPNQEFVVYDVNNPSGPFIYQVDLPEGWKWQLSNTNTKGG